MKLGHFLLELFTLICGSPFQWFEKPYNNIQVILCILYDTPMTRTYSNIRTHCVDSTLETSKTTFQNDYLLFIEQ